MIENIEKFYKLLKEDPNLAKRLKDAQEAYPGSWEIREPFIEETMLPLASEVGLEFTLSELRKYETRLKVNISFSEFDSSESVPDEIIFQLLDHGWENDVSIFDNSNI